MLRISAFEANWTRLTRLGARQKVLLNLGPLDLTKWFWWFIHEAKSLCKTKFVDVLHAFSLNIVECSQFSHLPVHQDLFYVSTTSFCCMSCLCTRRTHVPRRGLMYLLRHPHDLKTNSLQVLLRNRSVLRATICRAIASWPNCTLLRLRSERIHVTEFKFLHYMVLHCRGIHSLLFHVELSLVKFIE